MLLILLFWISLGVPNVTYGRNTIQTDKRTNVDLLKSLIYDNTKATVTLDSSALKQLIQLGSGNISELYFPLTTMLFFYLLVYIQKSLFSQISIATYVHMIS